MKVDWTDVFYAHVHLHGGPAPVRRYLSELIDRVFNGKINPGKVFDLTLPDQVVEETARIDDSTPPGARALTSARRC